jgi:hypothetical protein
LTICITNNFLNKAAMKIGPCDLCRYSFNCFWSSFSIYTGGCWVAFRIVMALSYFILYFYQLLKLAVPFYELFYTLHFTPNAWVVWWRITFKGFLL